MECYYAFNSKYSRQGLKIETKVVPRLGEHIHLGFDVQREVLGFYFEVREITHDFINGKQSIRVTLEEIDYQKTFSWASRPF